MIGLIGRVTNYKLLPCPFCGMSARLDNYVIEAIVRCTDCPALVRANHAPRIDTGIQKAVDSWNKRVKP